MDVLCWFEDLFSVDTCQVPSLPHLHVLRRETVSCENKHRGALLFLNKTKIKKGVGETLQPLCNSSGFRPESSMKLNQAGREIISTDWFNDMSLALKLLTAKS